MSNGRAGRDRAIAGIDHLLVGVRDLEATRRAWAHLGFTLSARGRHQGWGTANHCIMFPGDYIELLGIVDPTQFTNNLDRFLERREGLLGLAFAGRDLPRIAADLAARGLACDPVRRLSRALELPEGTVEPAFELLQLPAAATPGLAAFVCRHLTPELVWRSEWLAHANGACGLLSATAVVADPGAVAIAYGALFGDDAVWAEPGLVAVETGTAALRFVASEGLERHYPGLPGLARFEPPGLVGLRVAVSDLTQTADHLARAGVADLRESDRLIRVGPAEASGVVLEFEAAR